MADPISLIGLGVAIIGGIAGASASNKAQKEQEKAQKAQWQTELDTHQYNIDLTKQQLTENLADIGATGRATQRKQFATMGASGAEVGVGTPLMNMIETAAGIEKDKTGATRAAELEIEYRQGEIDKLTDLINPPKKKKKPEEYINPNTGGYGQTSSPTYTGV